MRGASHERTIACGVNLALSMLDVERWDDARTFLRKVLPVAGRSLGANHNQTLRLGQNLAAALNNNPEFTRDDPRLNQPRAVSRPIDLNTGDDLLEAENIMQDNVQRWRRVFGPAHPETRRAEDLLNQVHSNQKWLTSVGR